MGLFDSIAKIGLPIAGGLLAGPAGGLAGGAISGLFGGGGGKKSPTTGNVGNFGVDDLSISDDEIANIIANLGKQSGNLLAERQNSIDDLVAREGLGGQAGAALSRGAAIDAQENLSNQTANLKLQQVLSKNDAVRFLLGLGQQDRAFRQQRDSQNLGAIAQLASAIPGIFFNNGNS